MNIESMVGIGIIIAVIIFAIIITINNLRWAMVVVKGRIQAQRERYGSIRK